MAHAATTIQAAEMADEERDIVLWRVDQFARLGHGDDDAWALALSAADLGLARRLARSACPTEIALRILL